MNRPIGSKCIGIAACVAAVMLLGTVSSASAVDLSVGGVGFFASDFGGQGADDHEYQPIAGVNQKRYYRKEWNPWLGGGFGLFFDATKVEAGLGLTFAGGSPHVGMGEEDGNKIDSSYINEDITYSMTYLNISVLVKGPWAVYPAFGIDYHLCIAGSTDVTIGDETHTSKWDGKGNNPEAVDNSQLWIKFGLGYDHAFSDKVFLRTQALYGIAFASKNADDNGADLDLDDGTGLSHGLTIKVGVGYKL